MADELAAMAGGDPNEAGTFPAWMGDDSELDDYIQGSADDLYSNVDINVDDSYWSDFWGGLNKVLSSNTTKNLLNFGSGIYGMFEADKMKRLAEGSLKASDPFGKYRQVYGDQLLALMADPSSVTKMPGYEFQFNQGAEAVSRKMASRGYAGSGNEGIALTEYGQNFASSYFDKEATRLATLAGVNISPNFSAGLGGYASGIDAASQSLASLGYGSVYAGGASQGTPASRPNAAGGEAAAAGKTIAAGGKLLAGLGATGAGNAVSNVGGVISGVAKGGVGGTAQAVSSGAKLAENAGYVLPEGTNDALADLGSAASIYTGIQEGGVGGYAKAVGGAAQLAGYNIPYLGYVDAATKLAKGDVGAAGYSAMINAAGPIAAVGSAIADIANKSGDIKSRATSNLAQYLADSQGFKMVGGRTPSLVLPGGKAFVRIDQGARMASEALRKGDNAGFEKAWQDWMATAKPWYGG